MGKKHNYSFYGNVILIVQSSSEGNPFLFLTCIRKKTETEWEKPSQGEGKTVKCNLEELASIMLVLKNKLVEWKNVHEYKAQKTEISFKWETKGNWLKVIIGNYTKMLNYAQVELFKVLLKHILKEKLLFQSSTENIKTQQQSAGKDTNKSEEKSEEGDNQEHVFEFNEDTTQQKEREKNGEELSDKIKKEQADIKYDVNRGNYLENLFYEKETNLAVRFGRKNDEKVLWIPKSIIRGGWGKEQTKAQEIVLSFIPPNFGWQERKK